MEKRFGQQLNLMQCILKDFHKLYEYAEFYSSLIPDFKKSIVFFTDFGEL